ncbi:hypothetical protein RhiirA1_485764, partial [Rhizophagus irregularis]
PSKITGSSVLDFGDEGSSVLDFGDDGWVVLWFWTLETMGSSVPGLSVSIRLSAIRIMDA